MQIGARCVVLASLLLPSGALAEPWTIRSSVEAEVDSWRTDLGDEGLQAATILNLVAASRDWRFGVTSGIAAAEADSPLPELRGSLTTPLDTVLSASWRGLRMELFQLPVSFSVDSDVSVPTGRSQLGGRRKNLIFDPLLARYDRYGEGLNASFGVVGSVAVAPRFSIGLGIKHTVTGKYAPDGDQPDVSIDPGDVTSFLGQLTWQSGPNVVTLGAEYARESVGTRDGTALLQRAPSVEFSLVSSFQLSRGLTATLSGNYTSRGRDSRLNEITGVFERDRQRRDGDIWTVAGSLYYQLRPRTAVGVEGDYVSAGDNEIDDADFTYRPARRRWRAGVGVRQSLMRNALLTATARYVDYRDRGSSLLLPLRATGWTFAAGISAQW